MQIYFFSRIAKIVRNAILLSMNITNILRRIRTCEGATGIYVAHWPVSDYGHLVEIVLKGYTTIIHRRRGGLREQARIQRF